ncbi:unnamed protein product [Nezara viridula]|uniref:Eukaryotic translation initiation factor 4 gamma 2 n=1 Tax=Nezara viridula TaxID=85310 RepID=A0A9P0HCI3_NEZVI|nr:unnamed protein product [Nezara viridula]
MDDNRAISAKRWVPPSTVRRDALSQEDRNELIFRRVFEKALDEPKYSSMYARLCQRLCEEAPTANTKDGSQCTFRHLLLNTCKAEFEARTEHKVDKRKSLGNIKFVGELCKLGIVSKVVMFDCMKQLLDKKPDIEEMAEDLECLCQILRTCGQVLDSEQARQLMDQGPAIRGGERPPQQELFPRQLKQRTGLDVVLSSSFSFPQHDKFSNSPYNSNGFQAPFRDRGPQRQNHHHQQQNNHFYQQNRYNNQHNNNNSNNVSNSKDLAPRFIKRMMTAHEQSAANLEQVSLRPPAHSMLFKPPNAKPPTQLYSGYPGRTPGLLNDSLTAPALKSNPPIQTTKEVPILIKPVSTDKGKPNKKEKATSKEETFKKVSSLAEELVNGNNIEEIIKSFTQLKVSDRLMPECLHMIIRKSYDKTDAERSTVVTFLTTLKKDGVINSSHFHETFRNLVKTISDLESTVPNIYAYVAEIAQSAIVNDTLTIALLGELTEDGAYFPLLLLTLERLSKEMEKQELIELFNESKVSLLNSLRENERTKERLTTVLEERGLVFLEPLLLLEGELWAALERDPSANSLYRCAKENIAAAYQSTPSFVSALVTVCLRYITQESMGKGVTNGSVHDKAVQEKEKALLERFKSVLQAFLHEDINLQVTAVYALQVFCYSLEFPKGMLLRWFVNLYDLEIVEEEAFLKWREDVNNWLTWLAEAESEEEEEEDGDS